MKQVTSNRGSVKFMDGSFYDGRYNIVYIPLTKAGIEGFLSAVNTAEEEKCRRLTYLELDEIGKELDSSGVY
jgi:hypothetical protein